MSQFFTILTAVGEAKLANAQALGVPLEITHLAVGDGNGAPVLPLRTMTELVNEQRRAPLNQLSVDPQNASQIIAEQIIPENVGGWWIREIGLFDEDGDLVAIANTPDTYKPTLPEGSARIQTIRMVLIVSSAAAVQLKIDPAVVLASRSYADESSAPANKINSVITAAGLAPDKANNGQLLTAGNLLHGRVVASIAALLAFVPMAGASATTTAYHDGWAATSRGPVGGRHFFWNAARPKADHNGGTVISPTVPWDGTLADLADFLDGVGETTPAGDGCWVSDDEAVYFETFGALGRGEASGINDRAPLQAGFDWLIAQGGGKIAAATPGADYYVTGTHAASPLQVHAVQADLSVALENMDVQMLCSGLHDATIEWNGARISSGKTNGGATWVLDGCYNVKNGPLKMVGKTSLSADGTVVNVTGTGAVTILSRTAGSNGIEFEDFASYNHYSGVVATGDPAGAFRVKNVTLSGYTTIRDGYYGVCCQNNGDGVHIENLYTHALNRPFFLYGCDGVTGNVVGDEMRGGSQALIKAYSRHTRNINLSYTVQNRANAQARLRIQSQHNPALQATPATVKDVRVRYVEENAVAGDSITFDYYRDAVAQAVSADMLFDNIILEGSAAGDVKTNVTPNFVGAMCHVQMSQMRAANGFALLNGTGFVGSKRMTYAPALTFGGGAAGMAYTTQQGSYYVVDGLCHVFIRIKLSAKGASAGNAAISLPLTTHELELSPAIGQALGWGDMAGLTSPIIPWVGAPGGGSVTLVNQTAAGRTTLTNANFTDVSDLSIQIAYPI
jgi:hypothetical protein